MNIKELKEVLKAFAVTNVGFTPMIIGQHGIGKTQAPEQLARELGVNFVCVNVGEMADAGEFTGLPYKTKDAKGNDTVRFARPEWFPTEGRGIILLDEVFNARKDIQFALFKFLQTGTLGEHKLPEGWLRVAASNPSTEDYNNTMLENKALFDRFAFIHLNPTIDEWYDYSKSVGVHPDILDFVKHNPPYLRIKPKEDFSFKIVEPSGRTWTEVSKLYSQNLPKDLMKEILFGTVGIDATIAFFKRLDESKIDYKEVLSDYDSVRDRVLRLVTTNRTDHLKILTDGIVDFKGKDQKFSKKEAQNLAQLLLDIPRELGWATIKQLVHNKDFARGNYASLLGDNDELVNRFRATAKEYIDAVKKEEAKSNE